MRGIEMAAALPSNLSWMTESKSPIKRSHYTSCFCNPSTYSNLLYRKNWHLNTLSLLSSQSSFSSCCFCCIDSEKNAKKPYEIWKLSNNRHSFDREESLSSSKSIRFETNKKARSFRVPIKKNGRPVSLKSLFGKRSLWRRVFFASSKLRSIILLNVITLVYASNIPVVKEIQAVMNPAAFTAVRFAVSAIPFLPFVYQARDDAQTRKAGIELGLWVSLGYLMQALGLLTSDAGRASFISMLTIIVVPLIDGMLGAVVPTRTWYGAFMCLVGVAMLESSGSPPCVGDLLNFLSAFFFGLHMLRTEQVSRITDKAKFLSLLGYEVCVVAVMSVMWYFIGSWISSTQACDPRCWTWALLWDSVASFPWIPALYTGVFSTGLCLWIEMAAMCDVSATETAIIYALEPVWGAGFAWFLLGERWGAVGWMGAALVLGGSLAVQIYGSVPPHDDEDRGLQDDGQIAADKQNGLSTIVVSSKTEPGILGK